MYLTAIFLSLLPLSTQCTNVVLSNDDGWAEINIRSFYNSLTAAGDSVVLSAPAENESGTGTDLCSLWLRKKVILIIDSPRLLRCSSNDAQ